MKTHSSGNRKRNLLFTLLLILILLRLATSLVSPPQETTPTTDNQALIDAYAAQQSNIQIVGKGEVVGILPDDTQGSRHQRFIVAVAPGFTVLVSHNIDLAPRVDSLLSGDIIEFSGEYEWNAKGGVVHWTHHDPRGRHQDGWLRHQGQLYR